MKKPNTGMVVSSVAHVAVLAYAAIGFTHAKQFDTAPEALPVEVMTISEFDRLTKGEKTSKKVADKTKVEAKKVAAVMPEPKPAAPEAKENVEAPPPPQAEAPKPPEPKPPEPKPEPKQAEAPKPPEPKPEPKPEPPKQAEAPKPEPKPEPKPADKPKPPEKKPDDNSQAKLDDLIKKEVEKKPEPKPEPKKVEKKPPEKPKPTFDPTKIASLVDKRDPGRVAQSAPEVSNETTAGIANAPTGQLALSELSRINAMLIEQVRQCWSPPVGATGAGASDLAVVVQFSLSQDGALVGEPRVVNSSGHPGFRSAADSALRAVRLCSPLNLPVKYYDHWKFVEINFDPREMMGG